MPQSSSVMVMNTPASTRPHGRSCASSPLISVAISVACGAGSACEPICIV